MNISYIIAGFAFFFLPSFNIIDIFPDFIGCILILKGLQKLSDLTPGLMDAKNAFNKVLYLSIAKFLLMFSIPFFSKTDAGYILVFTFVFAVLDMIYTLPAFRTLLNGFSYLGDRTNSKALFVNLSEFLTLTTIFMIIRASLALLTDFSYISSPESTNVIGPENAFYLSNYRTLLTTINFLVTTIVGTLWFSYAVRYFVGIKKDKNLIDYLESAYTKKVNDNPGLFIRRRFDKALVFLMFAICLMYDFLIDWVNVIPDFFGGIFFILLIVYLRKYYRNKFYLYSSVVFTFFAAVSWFLQLLFATKYPGVSLLRNDKAAEMFTWVNLINIVKYISLAVLMYALYKVIIDIIREHTGSAFGDSFSALHRESTESLKKKNTFCLVFGVLSCVTGVIRISVLHTYGMEWFQFVDYAVLSVWVFAFIKLIGVLRDSIEHKYM